MATGTITTRIGLRVNALRGEKDWSASELAKRAGVKHPTVLRVEAGGGGTIETFLGIARAFGMTVSELVGEVVQSNRADTDIDLPGWSNLGAAERQALLTLVQAIAQPREAAPTTPARNRAVAQRQAREDIARSEPSKSGRADTRRRRESAS